MDSCMGYINTMHIHNMARGKGERTRFRTALGNSLSRAPWKLGTFGLQVGGQ